MQGRCRGDVAQRERDGPGLEDDGVGRPGRRAYEPEQAEALRILRRMVRSLRDGNDGG
jgi:hypothetical protein